ncbi:hypothetical protein HMN09_00133100 [Mycena chlorophos]|uniref:CxC1-like cysteine cluster associated with KDZ transposases domain-containing protein n=1 Tax=Mycena chlorophos TaxID=658473 RepID=A0A8H6TNK8_MYCCL|nr:hypothetical protein HMN09_00133100 [Mycena chlorophos]
MPATNSSGYTGGTEHYTDEVPIKLRRRGGVGAGRGVGPRKLSAHQVGAKSQASARSRAAREAEREERARQEIQRMQASGGHEEPWIDADVDMEHVMQELAAEENNRAQDQEEERRAFLETMMANLPKDTRDRSDRVQKIINGFRRVREPLTTAFLDWRADPNTCGTPWAQPWTLQDGNQQIKVHVVDIFGTNEMVLPVQRGSSPAVCLVRMGLIPCTVQFIKHAITVRTLELYRNLFLRCPKVGIQAFCSALSDLHLIPRNHNMDALFRTALDAYLDILANADRRAAAALGRDTPNWRIQNTCPPCQYPLKDETPLDPEMQATLDGNNSAKRLDVGSRQVRADDRKAPGDFYLTREAVDKWAKENIELLKQEYAAELQEANLAPGVEPPHCPDERWKNMQENLTATAMQAYDETGIMPCLCRHNFVLILVDMVHSGEMFKYGFAIVNHLARTLRKSVLFGYDIGCTFGRAVRRHPVLGPLTRKQRISFLVGAFHGAGHSRICQCLNLPRYRDGSGTEYDFLAGLQVEPPVETTQMEYYHALCTLSSTKMTWDKIKAETPDDTIMEQGDDEYRESVAATQRLETRRRHAKEKYDIALDDVQRLEQVLNILDRWTSDSQEYQEAAELVKHRNFHRALDELEMAVVSQAFESERLYVPGTGFNLRGQIQNAIRRRTKTIDTRRVTLNKCAAALGRPLLSEQDVANENFVAELALLRPSRVNIADQPWAKPGGAARIAMDLDFKLKRADEEITRLQIEIKRFCTWMADESKFLENYEDYLRRSGNPSLAFHVRLQRVARERFDDGHRWQLRKLVKDAGLDPAWLVPGESVDRSRHEVPFTRALAPIPEEPPEEEDDDVAMLDEEDVEDGDDVSEEAIADGIAAVVAAS